MAGETPVVRPYDTVRMLEEHRVIDSSEADRAIVRINRGEVPLFGGLNPSLRLAAQLSVINALVTQE